MPSACADRMILAAISPRLAIRSLAIALFTGTGFTGMAPASHPEDAEAAASGHRAAVHGRQGHAEDGPGVAGGDDAVVVEPRGDEEGVRLGLDLGLDLRGAGPVRCFVERPARRGGRGPPHAG